MTKTIIWLLFSGFLFIISRGQPQGIFGDGLEYVVQTQSFFLNQLISIDPVIQADYWNRTNPFNSVLAPPDETVATTLPRPLTERKQVGGGFGSLYPDRSQKYYYVHSWVYSLTLTPLYAFFHLIDLFDVTIGLPHLNLEYQSFAIFNSLLLSGALIFGLQTATGFIAVLFLLCSPLAGYLSWTTPEIFEFSLLCLAFLPQLLRKPFASCILLGLASAQNFPILVYLLPLVLLKIDDVPKNQWAELIFWKAQLGRLFPELIVCLFIGLSPWFLFFLKFGHPNLIVSLGQASLSYASLSRLQSFLLSPLAGVFWFYPVYFFLLPVLFFQRKSERSSMRVSIIITIIFSLILCYAMTGMINFHSQQLGSARYSAWIFAPLAAFLISASPGQNKVNQAILCFGSLITFGVSLFYQNYLFITGTHSRINYLGIFPDQAKKLYRVIDFNDEPEVLVETLLHKELNAPWEFDARYEIPVGQNQALCLVSLRSLKNGKVKFIPEENLCSNLKLPSLNSGLWKQSSALGSYYQVKLVGPT